MKETIKSAIESFVTGQEFSILELLIFGSLSQLVAEKTVSQPFAILLWFCVFFSIRFIRRLIKKERAKTEGEG